MRTTTLLLLLGAGGLGLAALVAGSNAADTGTPDSRRPSFRQRVVNAAVSQLGLTDAAPYIEDALGYPAQERYWCGMFALWAIHQAGLIPNVLWELGTGFASQHLKQINANQLGPGDVVYFHEPWQHHAIVEWVDHSKGLMSTINGNGAGGAVTRVVRPISDPDAYYSIGELGNDNGELQGVAV